jgi:GNAT superfamily N-acetyltransferase
MWWRRTAGEFQRGKGPGNRAALRRLVEAGPPPGLIAYRGGEPVGWVALAPRSAYARLERSRVLAPVDDRPVWSVVCFFIARGHRRAGMTARLLAAAARWAAAHGSTCLEGYPIDTRGRATADAFAWTGLASAFERAGFREVARRSPSRPIMRRMLRRPAPAPRSAEARRG